MVNEPNNPGFFEGRHDSGFTLAEVLIAISIGSAVLAVVATMFVASFKNWRDLSSDIYLIGRSRILREKLLRGPDRIHGLRQCTDELLDPQASHQARIFYGAGKAGDDPQRRSIRGNPIDKYDIW